MIQQYFVLCAAFNIYLHLLARKIIDSHFYEQRIVLSQFINENI